jgi:[ribosomal protein S5]-alanine N-acetyltransferase
MMVEIGYHVRRDYWGQGLATEAAIACREYGFTQLGCNQLVCLIHPNNVASRRVAEKMGMVLTQQVEWHHQPTCVYAVNAPKPAD